MGRQYKIIESTRKTLAGVTCDRCNHAFKQVTEGGWNQCGLPHSKYHEPGFEDYFYFNNHWGYASKKDGQTHECVLCEPCYDEVFKDIAVKITGGGISVDLEDFQ